MVANVTRTRAIGGLRKKEGITGCVTVEAPAADISRVLEGFLNARLERARRPNKADRYATSYSEQVRAAPIRGSVRSGVEQRIPQKRKNLPLLLSSPAASFSSFFCEPSLNIARLLRCKSREALIAASDVVTGRLFVELLGLYHSPFRCRRTF